MEQKLQLCRLGLKNQRLLACAINMRQWDSVRELKRYDDHLWRLFSYKKSFNFVSEIAKGKALLIGEGNLSFSSSLVRKTQIRPSQIVATTFEKADDLSSEAQNNAKKLKALGTLILHQVDATTLASTFGSMRFDNIVFQFPHAGSREPVEGRNPNYILVRDFLRSARRQLSAVGKVLISAVDSPHYRGAFQFDLAAENGGFQQPEAYPFDPSEFPGYVHSMTHEDDSAIDAHETFSTWVFRQ